LADQLDQPAEADDLAAVTLVADGDSPPLFLLPGIGGHVMFYRQMAMLLDTHQPVYGLEMRPEVKGNRVPRPMEQIASEFLGRVLTLQPDEPYFLAGYSFGGVLTFEIARLLQRQGRRVAFCALFDTFCHGYPRMVSRGERLRAHAAGFRRRSVAQNVAYITGTVGVQTRAGIHKLLRLMGVRKTDFYMYASPELEEMIKVCDDAWNAYKPRPLAGNLTLVRGRHRPERMGLSYEDPYNGWSPWAPDGVTVLPVDGDHLGLFESPVVEQVAAALSASIRDALARPHVW
jgi:aspartate racemase